MKIQTVKKYIGIATAAALTAAGAALAVQCCGIYRAGEFTRSAVGAAFRPIAWLVYAALWLTFVCLCLSLFGREKEAGPKKERQTRLILARSRAKADLESCEDTLKGQILAQRKGQRTVTALKYGILALCGAVFLVYALCGRHFSNTDINGSMVQAMAVAVPCLGASLGAVLLADKHLASSWEAEITLLKQAPKKEAIDTSPAPKKDRSWLRYAALGVAIALLVFGYFTGGTVDVLTKAVNICTECVGLG